MITLRQLQYFGALAEYRHFGRAAAVCAVSQPALSMQVRELEKQLGAELVERRPGDVLLTDLGAEVARRGERILAGARDLCDFVQRRKLLSGADRKSTRLNSSHANISYAVFCLKKKKKNKNSIKQQQQNSKHTQKH